MYIVRPCPPGFAGVDLISIVTPGSAKGFYAAGKRFVMRYGRAVKADEIAAITDEGLGVGFYSFGRQSDFTPENGTADAEAILDNLRTQGVPVGDALTLGLDLETPKGATIPQLQSYEASFAVKNVSAACTSGVYVGAGLGMSSRELFDLKATRYAKSGSRILDLAGNASEPECGYCLTQVLPFNQPCGGEMVDFEFSGADFFGRNWHMIWAVASGTAYSFPTVEPPPPSGGGSA